MAHFHASGQLDKDASPPDQCGDRAAVGIWGQRPKYSTEEKGRRSLSPTSCIYRLHLDVNLVRIVVLAEPKR